MVRRSLMTLLALGAISFPSLAATPEEEIRAAFDKFVVAQNAHDLKAVAALLLNSPQFLWINRGTAIWGREAALKRFESLYQGTWKLAPDSSSMKVISLGDTAAQLYVAITFNIGAPGQPAPDVPFLINQIWVKTSEGWRITSILPIPLPPPAPASVK